MKLQVTRDQWGFLRNVDVLNLSSQEWVLIKIALEKQIENYEQKVVKFKEYLHEDIENGEPHQETESLVQSLEEDLNTYKAILDALTEKR